MLELVLVRHGETDSNLRGTYCGWTDSPLNRKGEAQAAEAACKLKGLAFDAVYCSPLERAVKTAEIITGGVSGIIPEPLLKEHNFGVWEDMTYAEILERYPVEAAAWGKDWLNYAIEAGESAEQCYKRISGFIDALVSRYKEGRILLVTHLGVIKYILVHLLSLPLEYIWRFNADNGSVTGIIISEDGFAWINKLNS